MKYHWIQEALKRGIIFSLASSWIYSMEIQTFYWTEFVMMFIWDIPSFTFMIMISYIDIDSLLIFNLWYDLHFNMSFFTTNIFYTGKKSPHFCQKAKGGIYIAWDAVVTCKFTRENLDFDIFSIPKTKVCRGKFGPNILIDVLLGKFSRVCLTFYFCPRGWVFFSKNFPMVQKSWIPI